MLATIASYWFVTLPGVVTGLLLLHKFKQVRESKQSERRVGARAEQR
jgi:hypothetical protein